MGESYLSFQQVADRVGVSYQSARRWVVSGKLPHIRIGGVIRVAESDLTAFLEANKINQEKEGEER